MMKNKRLYGIRGACCVENELENIKQNVCDMYLSILQKNQINEDDIVSIQFTLTDDLDVLNPATALRKQGFAKEVALFCMKEPNIKGSMQKVIRILVTAYSSKKPEFVYLNGAERLRK